MNSLHIMINPTFNTTFLLSCKKSMIDLQLLIAILGTFVFWTLKLVNKFS